MDNKKKCRYWVAIGIILIVIFRSLIRPALNGIPSLSILLGVIPNLFGAFLLPIGGYLFLDRFIDFTKPKSVFLFCVTSFLLLICNEVLQRIPLFKRTFDNYDILASAIGLLISCIYCNHFVFKKIIPANK